MMPTTERTTAATTITPVLTHEEQQRRQRLEQVIAHGGVPIPATQARLGRYGETLAGIAKKPFTAEYQHELTVEATKAVLQDLEAAAEADRREAVRDLEQPIARARAELRGLPTTTPMQTTDDRLHALLAETRALRTEARTRDLERDITASDDPEAIAALFDEAVEAEDVDRIRRIGPAALARLRQLERAAMRAQPAAVEPPAVQAVRARVETTWTDWQRAHPTPYARLRALEAERAVRLAAIDSSLRVARKLYGLE
jgi:hypothetical protein